MPLDTEPSKPASAASRTSSRRPRSAGAATAAPRTRAAARTTVARNDAVDADRRRALIAQAAYFRAERRGFRAGGEEQDWLEAESEVDALLASASRPPVRGRGG